MGVYILAADSENISLISILLFYSVARAPDLYERTRFDTVFIVLF
jgi:hypothetical protein